MDSDRWQRKRERFERRMDRWERRWDRRYYDRRSPARHLFSGALFVMIGMLFLLGNMGMVNVDNVLRFWPVILIAVGVFKFVECRENYRQGAGIFWIVLGSIFLLGSFGILQMAFRQLWPVVLISLGALMLWRSSFVKGPRPPFAPPPTPRPASSFTEVHTEDAGPGTSQDAGGPSSNSIISATAILGSVERRNNSQDFRGGNATAIMGRCEVDLRAAAIKSPNEPILEVFAMWGGVEIRVPADWTVVSQVDPIMGGYEDSTQPPKAETKRFVIRGMVLMGGVEVTN